MTDLVTKWQAGDEGAFEALFHQHKNLVFKTALLMNNSGQEAEDILQDVFVTAWKSRQSFNPQKGKLSTWLYRITVNQSISRHRKKVLDSTPLDVAINNKACCESLSASPEDLVLEAMDNRKVLQAVNSMDSKHRSVLVLRYFNEMPYVEIAQALNIPLGTVKSRLSKAIEIMRRELDEGEAL